MFPFGFLRHFNTQYRCYPVSMLPGKQRLDVERGGKIIMPPSALEQLSRLNIEYPMLFKLTNPTTEKITHCGVLEFIADEDKIYLPYWMMKNLVLNEGDLLNIESASMPVATFSKFQPQSQDFLDISNPKAVLENTLRNFACLTTDDVIAITYNERVYELKVLETKPENAVSIIQCDMNVEFAPPVGYVEPQTKDKDVEDMDTLDQSNFVPETQGFVAFAGEGSRLDGKLKERKDAESPLKKVPYQRGVPDYDYRVGELKLIRVPKQEESTAKDIEKKDDFAPFSGTGQSLRDDETLSD